MADSWTALFSAESDGRENMPQQPVPPRLEHWSQIFVAEGDAHLVGIVSGLVSGLFAVIAIEQNRFGLNRFGIPKSARV